MSEWTKEREDAFITTYPQVISEARVREAFRARVSEGVDPQDLVRAAENYATSKRVANLIRDGKEKYIKSAHGFLNYEDGTGFWETWVETASCSDSSFTSADPRGRRAIAITKPAIVLMVHFPGNYVQEDFDEYICRWGEPRFSDAFYVPGEIIDAARAAAPTLAEAKRQALSAERSRKALEQMSPSERRDYIRRLLQERGISVSDDTVAMLTRERIPTASHEDFQTTL